VASTTPSRLTRHWAIEHHGPHTSASDAQSRLRPRDRDVASGRYGSLIAADGQGLNTSFLRREVALWSGDRRYRERTKRRRRIASADGSGVLTE
jgi:hypothetical protein